MAQERQSRGEFHELRQEIAHSRDRLARDLEGLKYELDFPLKFRKSFQRNAGVWISAAVLTGVAYMGRALPERKVVHVREGRSAEKQKKNLLQAGLLMGGLRFAVTLLRPVVVRLVARKIGDYASRAGGRRGW